MDFNTYQKKAGVFARYTQNEYPFIALGEEAGEVLGKLAKFVRKMDTSMGSSVRYANFDRTAAEKALKADLKAELGDVLWQLQQCATELGLSLEEVATYNLAKLDGRANRNTIVGSGDNR